MVRGKHIRRNKQCLHTNSATAKAMPITDNSRAVMQLANTPIKQDYALKAELNKIIDLWRKCYEILYIQKGQANEKICD